MGLTTACAPGEDASMPYDPSQIPVAYAMMDLVERLQPTVERPFTAFSCCWMAFNNIYAFLGPVVELKSDRAGVIKTKPDGHIGHMPQVTHVTEQVQIEAATAALTPALQEALIKHRSTKFFVVRAPRWQQHRIRRDAFGQRLNGVLKVSRTVRSDYPVWSPINPVAYRDYMAGNHSFADELTTQIVGILYTVRNNTFHGGKIPSDANDRRVLDRAFPLLHMIVRSFMW
jgi:hypothetical protein